MLIVVGLAVMFGEVVSAQRSDVEREAVSWVSGRQILYGARLTRSLRHYGSISDFF